MIYFDNAATTRPDAESVDRALIYLRDNYYNPSALYIEGFNAHKEIETARADILSHVAKNGFELLFTATGSEADNTAIFSFARRGNVVITQGEHAAIYNAVAEISRRGIEVRYAKLNRDGSVDEENLFSLIDDETRLVSVIHVNNETGATNDITRISRLIKKKYPKVIFHSDGVQAYGKIPFVLSADVDLYTISAHKIGGVRGVAGLIKKKNLVLHPLIFGGGQESGIRGGTENVFAIKQFEFAAQKKYASLATDLEHVRKLNEYLRTALNTEYFEVLSPHDASPYVLSLAAKGLRGEVLLHMVNDEGLLVGTGSACSSKNRYSRIMLACGLNEATASGVLRLSFCPQNTMKEAELASEILNRCARLLTERMK